VSTLRENREAAASPLLAIHERLDELTLAVDALTTTVLDPDADEQADYEAAEALVKIRAAAAKIRGHVVAGSPGEWYARQRAAALSQPFLSTDRRLRRERVVVDGLKTTTGYVLNPDGSLVLNPDGTPYIDEG
jgi:hypothetical protein